VTASSGPTHDHQQLSIDLAVRSRELTVSLHQELSTGEDDTHVTTFNIDELPDVVQALADVIVDTTSQWVTSPLELIALTPGSAPVPNFQSW
jgi:hypothetical protein